MPIPTLPFPSSLIASDRLAWWRKSRLGMFIHWGPYATLGGVWNGREIDGCAEHIRRSAPVPRADYERLSRAWTPAACDPAAWVALAQEAGLGYLVFTSKHHDGFCMWDSAHTDFSLARGASGRDIMRELHQAATVAGLPLGWYYSPRDWHHPDFRGDDGHPEPTVESASDRRAHLDRYIDYVAAQTAELLERYGPVATLWYDGQDNDPEAARSDELLALIRARSPQTLVNDRIGADGYEADYAICEGFIPGEGPQRPWETCLSLNYNWGYKASDQRWCSTANLARKACDAIGLGGNLLVNIGPDGDGRVPEPAVASLRGFGRWLRTHGEALRDTTALPPPSDGVRLTRGSGAIYALLLDPDEGELLLPRVWAGMAPSLLGGRDLAWKQTPNGVRIVLPAPRDDLPRAVVLPNATLLP